MNSIERTNTNPGAVREVSTPDPELVFGFDNVPIELPVARVGSRILAALVDYVLLFFIVLAWLLVCLTLGTFLGLRTGWGIAVLLLGIFLLEYGYFAVQEILWRGQTAGKRWVGLRVVARDGAEAGTAKLVLRNLVRMFDILVGPLLMALDPLARRLGDRIAGTLVVRTGGGRQELILTRLPEGWSPEEVAIVEAFLVRAPNLEGSEREALADRVASWVDQRAPGFLPVAGSAVVRLESGFVTSLRETP